MHRDAEAKKRHTQQETRKEHHLKPNRDPWQDRGFGSKNTTEMPDMSQPSPLIYDLDGAPVPSTEGVGNRPPFYAGSDFKTNAFHHPEPTPFEGGSAAAHTIYQITQQALNELLDEIFGEVEQGVRTCSYYCSLSKNVRKDYKREINRWLKLAEKYEARRYKTVAHKDEQKAEEQAEQGLLTPKQSADTPEQAPTEDADGSTTRNKGNDADPTLSTFRADVDDKDEVEMHKELTQIARGVLIAVRTDPQRLKDFKADMRHVILGNTDQPPQHARLDPAELKSEEATGFNELPQPDEILGTNQQGKSNNGLNLGLYCDRRSWLLAQDEIDNQEAGGSSDSGGAAADKPDPTMPQHMPNVRDAQGQPGEASHEATSNDTIPELTSSSKDQAAEDTAADDDSYPFSPSDDESDSSYLPTHHIGVTTNSHVREMEERTPDPHLRQVITFLSRLAQDEEYSRRCGGAPSMNEAGFVDTINRSWDLGHSSQANVGQGKRFVEWVESWLALVQF